MTQRAYSRNSLKGQWQKKVCKPTPGLGGAENQTLMGIVCLIIKNTKTQGLLSNCYGYGIILLIMNSIQSRFRSAPFRRSHVCFASRYIVGEKRRMGERGSRGGRGIE